MENQILDYSHAPDWSEGQVEAMKTWLSASWVALEGDEPDQDFLEYIMVMIKTQKKMHELQAELKDLGVDEEKARNFAISIGEKLQELATCSPREKKAEPKVISVVSAASQDKKSLGPLKSSRAAVSGSAISDAKGNANSVNAGNAGSSRLLQSALSSSRTVSNGNNNSNGQQRQQQGGNSNDNSSRHDNGRRVGHGEHQSNNHGQKRGQDNFNDRQDRDGFKRPNFNNHDRNSSGGNGSNNHFNSNHVQRTVSMAAPSTNNNQVTKNAAPAVGSVEYFQEMNKVAQASGFKNAQEMLASQKEMMSLMQGTPAPAPVPGMGMTGTGPPVTAFAPPAPMYPYPQQAFPMQPPYPGGAPPPPQGQPFYGGRGYAGRGGGRWEAGYTGRGGRGRGRGAGRGVSGAEGAAAGATAEGAEGATAPATDSTTTGEASVKATVAGPAIYAEMEQEQAAAAAGSYAGRGGGRGRGRGGYQGRGDWNAPFQPHQQQAFTPYPTAPFAPQAYTGRGYQGRGYQGRGGGRGFPAQHVAAAVGAEGTVEGAAQGGAATEGADGASQHNKVWVRKPDLVSALVTGR